MSEETKTPLRGVRVGRVRTEPLLTELRPKKEDETEATYARVRELHEMFAGVSITVRRQSRRVFQAQAMEIRALEAEAAELGAFTATSAAEVATKAREAAAKVDELADAVRRMFLAEVKDPRSGVVFGTVLVGVAGAEIEDADGAWQPIAAVTDPCVLVDHLEELGILELAADAAMRAQEPTRARGN